MVILEEFSFPFERARVLLTLGSVLQTAQQQSGARAALGQALVIFDEIGTEAVGGQSPRRAGAGSAGGAQADFEELTRHRA